MKLLARVFPIDVSVCSLCGGPMRIVRAVTDPDAIAAELHGRTDPCNARRRNSSDSHARSMIVQISTQASPDSSSSQVDVARRAILASRATRQGAPAAGPDVADEQAIGTSLDGLIVPHLCMESIALFPTPS
jgi:hypothetical protein